MGGGREGGENRLFGVADPRGDLNDGDNVLFDFIKKKIWVEKEEEGEAADNNTKGHNSDESLNEVERTTSASITGSHHWDPCLACRTAT